MGIELNWIISNLAHGPTHLLEKLLKSSEIITHLIKVMNDGDLAEKEIALWFLSNATSDSKEMARLLNDEIGIVDALYIIINQVKEDFDEMKETDNEKKSEMS